MSKSQALKACKHTCNSNEIEIYQHGHRGEWLWTVRCNRCHYEIDCFDTEEEAIEAWNTRPNEWKAVSVEYYDIKNDCQHIDTVPFSDESDTLWINSNYHHAIIRPLPQPPK